MKRRTFKTKRETLPVLILKTFLVASLICGVFAFIRWDMMCSDANERLNDKVDLSSYYANRIDSREANDDPLPEFINEMTRFAFTAVNIPDIYVPSFDEIIADILNYSYTSDDRKHVKCIDSGNFYDIPGCYSVAVITDDSGNIVGENTERFFLYINFRANDPEIFAFAEDTSDDPEIVSFFEKIKSIRSDPIRLDLELESVYVNWKTHEFIPCKGRINPEGIPDGTLTEYELLTAGEFSFSVYDEDFELISIHPQLGYYPWYDTLWFGGEKKEDIDRILECFKLSPYNGGISDYEKFLKLKEEFDIYNDSYCSVYLNGEQYHVYRIDTLKFKTPEFMKMFYKNVFSFSIIVFIIAALFCWWKNTRNKAKYAIEDYQRDVTDHLAHDLKTPLMAIGGYAENILDGKLTDEEQKEYLEAIIENVSFADSTMSRTLMLNSMDGSTRLKFENIDAGKVVSETVKKYEPLLEKNNISFSLEGGAEIKAELTSFEKIVENLISNAVKYTAGNGSIRAVIDRKKLVITNTVNGKIDTRKLKVPFVRGEESRSNLGGSGLGLSIAERAAALNGFRLNISCTDNEFKAEVKF